MTPVSPIFSSLRPHIFPAAHRTPIQLALSAEHGEIDAFQEDNAALGFPKDCLNLRRKSESEAPEEEAKTIIGRRIMYIIGNHGVPLSAILMKGHGVGLAHALVGVACVPKRAAEACLFCKREWAVEMNLEGEKILMAFKEKTDTERK